MTLRFGDWLQDENARKHGDPGWVVSDEVAGQAVASLGTLPTHGDWRLALIAFVLFRFFDMVKFGPVKRAEQMPGAVGVLLVVLALLVLRTLLFRGPVRTPESLTGGPFVDLHCHVAGIGAGDSGCFVSEALQNSSKFGIYLSSFSVSESELRLVPRPEGVPEGAFKKVARPGRTRTVYGEARADGDRDRHR